MNNKELKDFIDSVIEKTEMAVRLEQNVKVLNFVRSLHNQKRISDEVAHTFLLEFSLDI
jgi:hypothetical protein